MVVGLIVAIVFFLLDSLYLISWMSNHWPFSPYILLETPMVSYSVRIMTMAFMIMLISVFIATKEKRKTSDFLSHNILKMKSFHKLTKLYVLLRKSSDISKYRNSVVLSELDNEGNRGKRKRNGQDPILYPCKSAIMIALLIIALEQRLLPL